eukprot:c24450_g1_i1 orf=208-2370(-)
MRSTSNTMIKCLFMLIICTLSIDLAKSATTLVRRSRGTMLDDQELQYGMQISSSERVQLLDREEDDTVKEWPVISLDDEEEDPSQLKLQVSKVRRADQSYDQQYSEIDQVNIAHQSRKIPAKNDLKPSRRSAVPVQEEFIAGKDMGENDQENDGDSITIQELVDNGLVKEKHSTHSDRVAQHQIRKSTAKSTLIKHIKDEHVHQSNLEADDEMIQPADRSMKSGRRWDTTENADIYDAAGQHKLKSKKLPKKKPLLHQYSEDDRDLVAEAGAHGSKSDNHNQPAKGKQAARMKDGGDESVYSVVSSATPTVTTKSRVDHNAHNEVDDPKLDAGKESSDFHDKEKKELEEVVMAEENEEDKDLIPKYNLGDPIKNWDLKRKEWAREHPEVKQENLFILTGTQPWPCTNAEGDHLLLRCFKNKVDYSRIHGVGLFYNMALLDAHMPTFWAKLPVVRATMLAHPEVEWIWWLDADAIITDMEFSIPLHRYTADNLVVHGWESLIFEKRSWLGLNAGSFLLRNCQWSLDLLERWASMGPKAPMGDAYRHILSDFLPDRPRNPTDDQAALVFLLIKERQRWAGKLRVELDFFLSGYWLELKDGFEATEERYRAMEEQHAELLSLLERQGAVGKEKLVAAVGRARQQHLIDSGTSVHEKRPFVTHFTGCQPCSGNHNNIYSKEQCRDGLLRSLNYADDQVLRTLGYQHRALHLSDVLPSSPATATA